MRECLQVCSVVGSFAVAAWIVGNYYVVGAVPAGCPAPVRVQVVTVAMFAALVLALCGGLLWLINACWPE